MIKIGNLFKKYNSNVVLNDINFTIQNGELAVIYGLNGTGKTTLIKCLTGLMKPNSGSIQIIPDEKSKIGLYLGHEMLIEKLTIKEYLFFTGILKCLTKKDIESKILHYSKILNYETYLNEYISKISFGTKSKVLLTAAILNDPKILIMDEPFIGMDIPTIKTVTDILKNFKENDCTILISSHQVDLLENCIDKILILKNQKIILEKQINELNLDNKNQLTDLILSYLEQKNN